MSWTACGRALAVWCRGRQESDGPQYVDFCADEFRLWKVAVESGYDSLHPT